MESLKPCCYIWMSEESWTRYIWQDWGLHNRHHNPLVKISVSLMVHQESLRVLDSDHSINFHWSPQALKESINNTVWSSWATISQTGNHLHVYIVKVFSQLKLEGIISPLFGVTHEHLPTQATCTTWHMAWHDKPPLRSKLNSGYNWFFVFNLVWFSIFFVF